MMPDREKVIKAIDICLGHGKCDDCGYNIKGGYSTMDCRKPMMRDALALLKEQEVKEQISDAIHETAKQFRQTIVRCKDCKRYYANGGNCDQVLADWFCADGEPRTN